MNELYKELIKANERMNELYTDMQGISLDWLDRFWVSALAVFAISSSVRGTFNSRHAA
jgi:hypothetical protein